MYSMVKDYMKNHDVLVSYVRNDFGYLIGVVVALGKNRVGWSMVNPTQDVTLRKIQPHQLPVVQFMKSKASHENKSFNMYDIPACQKLVRKNLIQEIPQFNKTEGLRRAIECAENSEVHIDGDVITGKIPRNPNMLNILIKMVERSQKVKRYS